MPLDMHEIRKNISGYFLQTEMFRLIIMHPKGQSEAFVLERRIGR